jgi:uncharacterized protein YndB with AHSA1/START domain
MMPTGRYDPSSRSLVLERRFAASIDDVWLSITESARLARWYGTWTGDPSSGSVMVTMTAEAEPVPPTRHVIEECEPPRLLEVTSTDDHGSWRLRVELSETTDGTVLVFRQMAIDPGAAADVGPGWEWYLDRLVASVTGDEPPGLPAFESEYMPLSGAYSAMSEDSE